MTRRLLITEKLDSIKKLYPTMLINLLRYLKKTDLGYYIFEGDIIENKVVGNFTLTIVNYIEFEYVNTLVYGYSNSVQDIIDFAIENKSHRCFESYRLNDCFLLGCPDLPMQSDVCYIKYDVQATDFTCKVYIDGELYSILRVKDPGGKIMPSMFHSGLTFHSYVYLSGPRRPLPVWPKYYSDEILLDNQKFITCHPDIKHHHVLHTLVEHGIHITWYDNFCIKFLSKNDFIIIEDGIIIDELEKY